MENQHEDLAGTADLGDGANTPASGAHTAEPWTVETDGAHITIRADGYPVAEMWMSDGKHEANARRIVACVNACKGAPTALLERSSEVIPPDAPYSAIVKQRDELAAALRMAGAFFDKYGFPRAAIDEVDAIRAALAALGTPSAQVQAK